MPDVSPDWSAPGLSGLIQILSWGLAWGMVIAGIGLLASISAMATKGFGRPQIAEIAPVAAAWSLGALALLGAFSGVMALAVGFDLGL